MRVWLAGGQAGGVCLAFCWNFLDFLGHFWIVFGFWVSIVPNTELYAQQEALEGALATSAGCSGAAARSAGCTYSGAMEREEGAEEAAQFAQLDGEVFEECLGPRWAEQQHLSLDFSSNLFCLESLGAPGKGLLDPRLRVSNLLQLDLANNALREVAAVSVHRGFKRLQTLNLHNNLLTSVLLQLPSLRRLDLSKNQLQTLPDLQGLRNLEELLLSHNRISGPLLCFLFYFSILFILFVCFVLVVCFVLFVLFILFGLFCLVGLAFGGVWLFRLLGLFC